MNVITNSIAVAEKLKIKPQKQNVGLGLWCKTDDKSPPTFNMGNPMRRELTEAPRQHTDANQRGIMEIGEITFDAEDEAEDKLTMNDMGHWMRLHASKCWVAHDDVSGVTLKADKVVNARREEMEYFKSMGVYDLVHRDEVKRCGGKLIDTRWIDVNKGDSDHEDYRSRLVGKEFKRSECPELFAATPPLETLKILLSFAATDYGDNQCRCIMVNDIKRAYFNALAMRDLFIEIPKEDSRKQPWLVGKLKKALYGTRDAAKSWQQTVTKHLVERGFTRHLGAPSVFYNGERGLCTLVHGDDYVSVGERSGLQWLQQELEGCFEVKTTVIGNQRGLQKELKVLNRVIRFIGAGIEYELDDRHAAIITKSMGLQKGKPVTTPGTDEVSTSDDSDFSQYNGTDYRALAARANYLAQDRPDIQYIVKEICRAMSDPQIDDWRRLKRLGRFLLGRPRLVQNFAWQKAPGHITVYTDANWGGCKKTRKSTSAGCVKYGSHTWKTWSKTQSTVATSSAEAELYGIVRGTQEALASLTMLKEFAMPMGAKLVTDASAALAISQREGLGKLKHIDISWLWIQDVAKRKPVLYGKVPGVQNPADAMTKYLTKQNMDSYMGMLNYEYKEGKAEYALKVASNAK